MSYGIIRHSKAKMRRVGSSRRARTVKIEVRIERIAMQWKGAAAPKFTATACVGGSQRGGYARDSHSFAGSRRCVWHVEGSTPTRAMKSALRQLLRRIR